MPDFIADGQPYEAPEEEANNAYQNVSPGLGKTLLTEFENGPVNMIGRAAERGGYAGSSTFDQLINMTPHPVESPTISAEEANQKYAPEGSTITDKPIPEALAQVIGKQKGQQMARDRILSRFQNNNNGLANFVTGMAGFALDPLNAASFFIPGLGEEAVLDALGTGLAARTAARATAGATAAGAAQVPLSGLRMGLSPEEATDYSIRDAARDVAFGAAGGALFGAVLGGALHESGILAPDAAMTRLQKSRVDSLNKIKDVPAKTQHEAIGTAVSQLADGRPIEVTPLFDPLQHIELASRLLDPETFKAYDDLKETHENFQDSLKYAASKRGKDQEDTIYSILSHVNGDETKLGSSEVSRLENARKNLELSKSTDSVEMVGIRRKILDTEGKISDLLPKVQDARDRATQYLSGRDNLINEYNVAFRQLVYDNVHNVANSQAKLYRDGYTHGVSRSDLASTKQDIYNPEDKDELEKLQRKSKSSETASVDSKPSTPEEQDLMDLENQWLEHGPTAEVSEDEQKELNNTNIAVNTAQNRERGYKQAASCVKGAV